MDMNQDRRARWRAYLFDQRDGWLDIRDRFMPGTPAHRACEKNLEKIAEMLREIDDT